MKEGALDFLAKPVDPDHLLLMVERALAQRRLATENILLKEELAARRGAPQIVGEDPRLKQVTDRAAARGRHRHDGAARGRERHRQGAVRARAARAQPARRRSVCRDQLRGDSGEPARDRALRLREGRVHRRRARASPASSSWRIAARCSSTRSAICRSTLQAKILRALEEKRFERVGGTTPLQVDVRVVAATNRNLRAAVAARQFREDLYFRLSVFPITIPPLRERPRRHPDAGDALHRAVQPRPEQEAADAGALGRRGDAGLPVAGQRARAAELHRARGDSHRGRHDSRAASQPVVPMRPGARRPSTTARGRASTCRARWPTRPRGWSPKWSGARSSRR